MVKKHLTLDVKTKNTSFEEIFNILTYESSTTKINDLTIRNNDETSSPHRERIVFQGSRNISYAFVTTIGKSICQDFPAEIDIKFGGSVDSNGNVTLVTTVPETYSSFLKGKEIVTVTPQGDVKMNLSYFIIPSTEDGIFGSIKNQAYNSVTSKIEERVLDLYRVKRPLTFGQKCIRKITSLEDLRSALTSQRF